jgi:hypothetical protein
VEHVNACHPVPTGSPVAAATGEPPASIAFSRLR